MGTIKFPELPVHGGVSGRRAPPRQLPRVPGSFHLVALPFLRMLGPLHSAAGRKGTRVRHTLLQLLSPYIPSAHCLMMKTGLESRSLTFSPSGLGSVAPGSVALPSSDSNTARGGQLDSSTTLGLIITEQEHLESDLFRHNTPSTGRYLLSRGSV